MPFGFYDHKHGVKRFALPFFLGHMTVAKAHGPDNFRQSRIRPGRVFAQMIEKVFGGGPGVDETCAIPSQTVQIVVLQVTFTQGIENPVNFGVQVFPRSYGSFLALLLGFAAHAKS